MDVASATSGDRLKHPDGRRVVPKPVGDLTAKGHRRGAGVLKSPGMEEIRDTTLVARHNVKAWRIWMRVDLSVPN